MTEAEWLACTDPKSMLGFLRGNVSDRKLRLFAVACCRSIWQFLTERNGRVAVEMSERYADAVVNQRELAKARRNAQKTLTTINKAQPQAYENSRDAGEAGSILMTAINAAESSADKDSFSAAWSANTCAAHTKGFQAAALGAPASYDDSDIYVREELAGREKQYLRQRHLLHDIFGNPFRTLTIAPSWLSWNNVTIPKLAPGIYTNRAFDRLPILADALEVAGCDNADILAHCRNGGEHVRGCWVVDLLLGKS